MHKYILLFSFDSLWETRAAMDKFRVKKEENNLITGQTQYMQVELRLGDLVKISNIRIY